MYNKDTEYTESQMEICTQIIREIVSLRTYARTLGDDVLDAIDDLDTQVEKKIKYLIRHTDGIGRMEGAVAKEQKIFKEYNMKRKSHKEIMES